MKVVIDDFWGYEYYVIVLVINRKCQHKLGLSPLVGKGRWSDLNDSSFQTDQIFILTPAHGPYLCPR